MTNPGDKLKSAIARSALHPDEQTWLINVLARADDAVAQPIIDLCTEDARWAEKIYQNYQAKQTAIAADDPEAWSKIIHEEEQALRDLAR